MIDVILIGNTIIKWCVKIDVCQIDSQFMSHCVCPILPSDHFASLSSHFKILLGFLVADI